MDVGLSTPVTVTAIPAVILFQIQFFRLPPCFRRNFKQEDEEHCQRVSVPDCVLRAIVIIMAEGICRRERIKF